MDSTQKDNRPQVVLRQGDLYRVLHSGDRIILGLAIPSQDGNRYSLHLSEVGNAGSSQRPWPCLLSVLPTCTALGEVEEGLELAKTRMVADGDALSTECGVVVFFASSADEVRCRAFAGRLDKLVECEVQIVAGDGAG